MAFEGLADKLANSFKRLKSKGKLTEADVREAMREVRLALLEADVNYKVAKDFTNTVTERAIGTQVMESLTPGQMVVKIVDEELTNLMGGEEARIATPPKPPTIIMMVGLQGAGKTTHAAKLAKHFKSKGNRPMLVACDIYRPAAIKQLQVVGEQAGVPVFEKGNQAPVKTCEEAIRYARDYGHDIMIIDTAGRLQIDEELMNELREIKEKVGPHDTRGGAALSIRAVTGKPIKFVGVGEKLDNLEVFHPDRMASRILGMGDVLTLIEDAQSKIDEKAAEEAAQKILQNKFDLNDLLNQFAQVRKMGPLKSVISKLPGMDKQLKDVDVDDRQMDRMEAIILSMTEKERQKPDIINPSRKRRIAAGSGMKVEDVNRLLKQFETTQKLMRQMRGKKGKRRPMMPPGMGGMGGMGGF